MNKLRCPQCKCEFESRAFYRTSMGDSLLNCPGCGMWRDKDNYIVIEDDSKKESRMNEFIICPNCGAECGHHVANVCTCYEKERGTYIMFRCPICTLMSDGDKWVLVEESDGGKENEEQCACLNCLFFHDGECARHVQVYDPRSRDTFFCSLWEKKSKGPFVTCKLGPGNHTIYFTGKVCDKPESMPDWFCSHMKAQTVCSWLNSLWREEANE